MSRRIAGVVFDMDGLLIDSEPLWQAAEIEVFESVGVHLNAMRCRGTQGMRILEVVNHWYRQEPWSGPSVEEVRDRVLQEVFAQIRQSGTPLPGAIAAVRAVEARGLACALASSSPMHIITSVIETFGIRDAFQSLHSADQVSRGKPHPAVFSKAVDALGLAPHDAVGVEDSVNGLISCLAAGMVAVAVPAPEDRDDPRYTIASHRLDTLEAFPALLETLC